MNLFSHSWLPFMYLYGLGGLLFVSGILITVKSKSLNLNKISHWRWFWTLIFGFIWYMSLHASLTLAALGKVDVAFMLFVLVIFISLFGTYQVLKRKEV